MGEILLVDDSELFRHALGGILEEAGYKDLKTFGSGVECLDYLKSDDRERSGVQADLLLMDVMMPDMNGIEVVKTLKSDPILRDIPVVMVSAANEEEKIKDAFEAGAIDYITKPLKKLELRVRVNSVLRMKREMDQRKSHERELEKTVDELRQAMSQVKQLGGLLPICAHCKKIRNDKGYWEKVENYISNHSRAHFSHAICPECTRKNFPDLADKVLSKDD